MASKYEQALALSKQSGIPVPQAVAQIRTQSTPGLSAKDAQGFVAGTPTYNQGQNNGWGIEDPMNPRYANRASTNANQQQLINNQNKVQAEIQAGTRNAVGTSVTPAPVTTPAPVAPVSPNTPAPVQNVSDTTPVQPAPVEVKAPVKPVTPTKTEAPIDYTQAQGREQEITTNVKGFIDSGMTPDQAKQASGYNEASPEKKAIIDGIITGASQGALLNEKDALNALISGVSVPKQNTQAFRNAEFKANKFRKFNSMTPTQLLDNLKMGEIGSEMDQLLSQNPNYAQAKQKLNELQKITNLNKTMSNLVTGAKGTEVPTITPEQDEEDISAKLTKKYGLDDANASAFAEFIATDEEMADNKAKLLVNKNQLSNVNRQIADATTLLNQGIKDLKSQYPDMSASGIITLMGSRLGEFNDAITNLNSTKTLLQADIKDEMDLAKSAYDAKSADIQAQNQIKSTMALNEYKSDFEKQQAEAALNDPATQIKSTLDEFAKLGIVAQGDLTSKLAEFKTSGKTLPEYISGLRTQFMSKPEYKKIQALQTGQLSEAEKLASSQSFDLKKMGISNQQDIQKLVAQYDLKNASDIQSAKIDLASKGFTTDQVDSIIRSSTGNWKGATGTTLLTAPDGTIIPSRLSQTTNKNNGKECGEYVNDITGIGLGSTWESKKKKVDSSIVTPTVGDTAIWIPDPSNKNFAKYGHAGIVTASDGTNVTIKSSNLNGRGEISTVTVPISKITQTGGFANTSIKGTSTGKPLSDKQYTQYNQATSKFVADPNVKAFEAALAGGGDLIASLKSANGPGDVGAVFGFMKSLDPASVVKEGEFALAAKSAGVWEQFKNIPANKLEGTILTEDQRKAFGKLAFEYIKQKGKLYDIKYNDYTKILKNQGITDTYYPTKMTDIISSVENGSSPQKSDFLNSLKSIATEFTKGLTSIK